jgi:hypothetical protein
MRKFKESRYDSDRKQLHAEQQELVVVPVVP